RVGRRVGGGVGRRVERVVGPRVGRSVGHDVPCLVRNSSSPQYTFVHSIPDNRRRGRSPGFFLEKNLRLGFDKSIFTPMCAYVHFEPASVPAWRRALLVGGRSCVSLQHKRGAAWTRRQTYGLAEPRGKPWPGSSDATSMS